MYNNYHELKINVMKKMILWTVAAIAVVVMSGSCKVCTECIESHTGVSSDYCGTNKQVNDFEDGLKEQGGALGQDWNCERK
jgi:hypothetical protein